MHLIKILSSMLITLTLMANAQAATHWVSKAGNDTNPCTQASPCLTIQRGVHVLKAGDTLNITRGTYSELATLPSGTPISHYQHRAGIVLVESGTASQPIVIQAAPGDEGHVKIDQKYQAMGFYFKFLEDYIHIKNIVFERCRVACILSPDVPGGNADDPDSLVSRGVVVEGNSFLTCRTQMQGINSATIRMDSSRNWTIKNNLIYGSTFHETDINSAPAYVPNSGAVYAYNIFDTLVINNEIRDAWMGIWWKDTANNPPLPSPSDGEPSGEEVQSIIKYNKIINAYVGVGWHAGRAGDTAGFNIVTNNIIENVYTGIYVEGDQQEGWFRISQNFINIGNGGLAPQTRTQGIAISASDPAVTSKNKVLEATGNIFHNTNQRNIVLGDVHNQLEAIDINYNVYSQGVNAYIHGGNTYSNLSSWRSSNSHPIVADSNPGEHSIENIDVSLLASDIATGDYALPTHSAARGMMPNGDNAGPYQKDNEVIGLLSSLMAPKTPTSHPKPPSTLSVKISP